MAAPEQTESESRSERIRRKRLALPDAPGVYLFKDARGKVIYVGKATSIRKRVAGHFSKPSTRGALEMTHTVADFDFLVTETEAEALLTEQNFIKRHRPRYNVRLRDDKSYPYIGISMEEDYPRVFFTREKHRRGRAYFGPFSSAKRVRETLELLGKVFQYRTCQGKEPGRQSGSPCLDYFIKRCQAPCVDYISKEEYRAEHRDHHRLPVRALPADREGAGAGHARGGRATRSSRRPRSCATSSRPCARCWSASA